MDLWRPVAGLNVANDEGSPFVPPGARNPGFLNDPGEFAEQAERLYAAKFKTRCEREHLDEFVAIDVENEGVYIAARADDALEKASKASPHVPVHLMRVGSPTAFRTGYRIR